MKKKVLHLLSSNSLSGAERVAINIINSLKEDYDFVYVSPKGPIEETLKEYNIKHISIDNINPYTLNKLFRLWKPDIVHAHDFRASIKSAISLYKCKKISHIHQNPLWIKSINKYSIAYAMSCPIYSNIITVSNEIKDEAIFSKISSKKIHVLENYIDKKLVEDMSNINETNKMYDLLYVGRLEDEKNPLLFINLVKQIQQSYNVKACIVGDGSLFFECNKLISEYKLNEHIELLGYKSNPFNIMKNSKVLVITSKWEGFGLVAAEAMILGKPVVANSVGGLKSIITNQSGKLCESESDYLNELEALIENSSYYNSKSKKSLENAKRYTDVDKFKSILKKIYNS
ncbi:glycosyltransferase [Paraclostridium bifermentans]|uniref:glycosyltransferase n=1 Tax=Paraclostridium TaxID=1849822 RepID=UPI001CC3FF5B|nr:MULTISPECIES: glycosyltransferase [Paraclostridium]MBZ6006058.1 glycosyltransferase [Paraclostridium bifermentans]MDU0298589.1 glycosyltransferase [Paraclostridium sp. MRS3W1]